MRSIFFLAFTALIISLAACDQTPKGIETEHGYRFIHHINKGGAKAQPGDMISVNVFTFIGDSMVGSTIRDFGGPRTLTLYPKDQLPPKVPPLYDAALLMGEGDSATVVQPIDSSMVSRIPKKLRDQKEIRFNIVLIDIITAEEQKKKQEEAIAMAQGVSMNMQNFLKELKAGSAKDIITTPTGLKVQIVEKGDGAAIKDGDNVSSHYFGCLMNGTMFDNSYDRGEPMGFQVGGMIPGFDEGIKMLTKGSKAYLVIPSALGYGEQGSAPVIPPNSDLVFFVDIQK